MFGWHLLSSNKKLGRNDGRDVKPGQRMRYKGNSYDVHLCRHGMHASDEILKAFQYHNGPILCRVFVEGISGADPNKFVGTHRTVLWMVNVNEKTDVNKSLASIKAKAKNGKKKKLFEALENMRSGKADVWDVYRLMEARIDLYCIGSGQVSKNFVKEIRYLINHFIYDEQLSNTEMQDIIANGDISEKTLQSKMIAKAKAEKVWIDDLEWLSNKK